MLSPQPDVMVRRLSIMLPDGMSRTVAMRPLSTGYDRATA
jgi:hypothetical protein